MGGTGGGVSCICHTRYPGKPTDRSTHPNSERRKGEKGRREDCFFFFSVFFYAFPFCRSCEDLHLGTAFSEDVSTHLFHLPPVRCRLFETLKSWEVRGRCWTSERLGMRAERYGGWSRISSLRRKRKENVQCLFFGCSANSVWVRRKTPSSLWRLLWKRKLKGGGFNQTVCPKKSPNYWPYKIPNTESPLFWSLALPKVHSSGSIF